MEPKTYTLACETCTYYNHEEEYCEHPKGINSEACLWQDENGNYYTEQEIR